MHVGLVDLDHHPALGPPPAGAVELQPGVRGAELLVGHDLGGAVDVQPDQVLDEVDHEQPEVPVLRDITQARQHPVAAVLRIGERVVVEHSQDPGGPARSDASHSPKASAEATKTISIRPMNSTIAGSSRSQT